MLLIVHQCFLMMLLRKIIVRKTLQTTNNFIPFFTIFPFNGCVFFPIRLSSFSRHYQHQRRAVESVVITTKCQQERKQNYWMGRRWKKGNKKLINSNKYILNCISYPYPWQTVQLNVKIYHSIIIMLARRLRKCSPLPNLAARSTTFDVRRKR